MANTSSRTLRLLSLLQSRRYWPGQDLADRLEVSTRTLRRDVDRLRELGYPVEAARGVDGGYQLAAGASLPPLALDDEEAVALAVGLQAATAVPSAGALAEPALRALAKVVQVMPPRLRRQVDALRTETEQATWSSGADARPGPSPAVLLALAEACRASEGATLTYTAADGARTQRRVEPHRLVTAGRRWYLVAYDLGRQDWRSLRVDRIDDLQGDGRRFRPRDLPAADAAAFVQEGMTRMPTNHDVSAVVAATTAEVRSRIHPWARLEDLPDGRCRITMRVDRLDWAASTLLLAGGEISDVRPPALADELRVWSGRLTRAVEMSGRAAPRGPR